MQEIEGKNCATCRSYLHALGENWKMRLNKVAISNVKLITDNNFGLTGLIKKLCRLKKVDKIVFI